MLRAIELGRTIGRSIAAPLRSHSPTSSAHRFAWRILSQAIGPQLWLTFHCRGSFQQQHPARSALHETAGLGIRFAGFGRVLRTALYSLRSPSRQGVSALRVTIDSRGIKLDSRLVESDRRQAGRLRLDRLRPGGATTYGRPVDRAQLDPRLADPRAWRRPPAALRASLRSAPALEHHQAGHCRKCNEIDGDREDPGRGLPQPIGARGPLKRAAPMAAAPQRRPRPGRRGGGDVDRGPCRFPDPPARAGPSCGPPSPRKRGSPSPRQNLRFRASLFSAGQKTGSFSSV